MAIDDVSSTVTMQGDAVVLRIEQPSLFRDDACALYRETFNQLIETANSPRLVLDMSRVQEIGSRMLGVLIMSRKEAEEKRGRIVLAAMRPAVAMSFRVAGLNKSLRGYDTLDDAVSALNKD